jgi:hypothetical protein
MQQQQKRALCGCLSSSECFVFLFTGGFTWTRQEISQASKDLYSSSYTACTHDVALNATDFCIGSFWKTTERMLMTPFTGNINMNEFKLVTFSADVKDEGFFSERTLKLMKGPLVPFTQNLWLAVCAIAFYMSISLRVIEGNPHEGSDDTSFIAHLARVCGLHVEEHIFLWAVERVLADIIKCIYHGVVGVTQGMHSEEVVTLPGRIVSTGYTVFVRARPSAFR